MRLSQPQPWSRMRVLAAGAAFGALTCNSTEAPPEPPPASFHYIGGWGTPDSCVGICGVSPNSPLKARPPAVVCFNKDDLECRQKTGDSDYDFLLLAQLWLPSFCLGLADGYDVTVTHQAGAICRPSTRSFLSIHGLWPNYVGGFPQCCGDPQPLDPAAVSKWPASLLRRLAIRWPDPTVELVGRSACEIWNHEWQKHGTCMEPQTDAGAQAYFERGLAVDNALSDANAKIDGFRGTVQSLSDISALYPKSVQVMCDKRRPERLMEIRTCWTREHEPRDCSPAAPFGQLIPCGSKVKLPVWESASEAGGGS